MRKRSVLYVSMTFAAACLFVGCGDDPSPVKPSALSPSPFASIQVIGPDSLEPGQSAQFVANIRQTDGTTKSATSMPNLTWRSSNASVMSVSNSGVVTARSVVGDAVISAEQGAVRGEREVVIQSPSVVPNGPYALSVSAERVTAGSPLSISWVAPSGRSVADWISIYKVGSGHDAYSAFWWDYTGGSSAGSFTIPAPAQPGLYEFRYFLDDGFDMAAKSSIVEVTANATASPVTLLVDSSATDGTQPHAVVTIPRRIDIREGVTVVSLAAAASVRDSSTRPNRGASMATATAVNVALWPGVSRL